MSLSLCLHCRTGQHSYPHLLESSHYVGSIARKIGLAFVRLREENRPRSLSLEETHIPGKLALSQCDLGFLKIACRIQSYKQNQCQRSRDGLRASVISIVILLSVLPLISMSHTASANPGSAVDDPTNIWAPYGPSSPSLLYSFYTNEGTEFNDFLTGHLDLTDWPQPATTYPTYDSNPDFVLSRGQGQFGMYGIDFNYAASTWAAWGCDWQHGNGNCGIEIREAFAHLVDRPKFVTD